MLRRPNKTDFWLKHKTPPSTLEGLLHFVIQTISCKLRFPSLSQSSDTSPPFPIFLLDYSHPNLPRAVTFNQLEVLAQVVVGAEAHFEDLDGPSVPSEVQFGVGF